MSTEQETDDLISEVIWIAVNIGGVVPRQRYALAECSSFLYIIRYEYPM